MFRENVVGARIWLFTIKLIEGKATEEEKKNMIDFLSTIVNKKYVVPHNP
jgi:phenylpyruvate tautomerase PptA (4-oxalocrotonate tautomerase family)